MLRSGIRNMLRDIVELLYGVNESSGLNQSLSNFNDILFDACMRILNYVMLPAAFVILSLFFLLELQKLTTRVEAVGGSQLGVEPVIKILVKMAICVLVVTNVSTILESIYDTSVYLINQTDALLATDANAQIDMVQLERLVNNMGLGEQIVALLVSFVVWLVVVVAVLLVTLIVIGRFIELFLLITISPLPIATIPHEEHSAIAKNFFRRFAAVSIQGILLFLVLRFYPFIITHQLNMADDGGNFLMMLMSLAGFAVVLIIAILGTNAMAKSIASAQ
ncbi:MAG: CD0415/CD1112 family protein [Oscillospiraceae bacterium]|nr:CD0415/CD1112 family protein [Oscillospiraceae bacterium]